MPLPSWDDRDSKHGTMIKGALWLVQVIGEGNVFTKEQVRQAFPGVSQADRRIRDLRKYDWVILASTEDATLAAEEQRFVKAGVRVWDPRARRAADSTRLTFTAKERQAIMERDGYMCTVCGITGAESYPDDPNQTAVLAVNRRTTVLPDGSESVLLITECKRCRRGGTDVTARADDALQAAKELDDSDMRRLLRWLARGRRGSTPLERAWNAYRRLPADAQNEVRRALGS